MVSFRPFSHEVQLVTIGPSILLYGQSDVKRLVCLHSITSDPAKNKQKGIRSPASRWNGWQSDVNRQLVRSHPVAHSRAGMDTARSA